MDLKGSIKYLKPYYTLVHQETLTHQETYIKFINWVSGEFDLYLQEKTEGLKIYYPNVYFNIKNIANSGQEIKLQITILSRSKEICYKINKQLQSIFNQIIQIYNNQSRK
ncbi:hypothetical protein FPF71_07505 [Algibacter amylolyticus]|uniref:Uncharacterized protein n=1 Tax=Algibacter amylolyticus TaxID=1608400 RepID=A0A5M7BC48_9FLAO|nr:hypothetical protein [Algibacter amylolyticus]KAA5825747.1 hypothetical protein F2B50_07505 [Algibacter amylolyticus]MBB5268018.1 hypothetical protein [Algibacter amylolyticus]TSJ80045.1 hypothetical protein FPF71_07505 [Algibacter amylolyticus]